MLYSDLLEACGNNESARRVEKEGGTVIKTMRGKDGKYVDAAIQDAVGAALALTQA